MVTYLSYFTEPLQFSSQLNNNLGGITQWLYYEMKSCYEVTTAV